MRFPSLRHFAQLRIVMNRCFSGIGSGAGRGGGGGGSIREAGGRFGEIGAANEEDYFRKLQQLQLAKLKVHVTEDIETALHEKQMIRHRQAILNRKKRVSSATDRKKHI